MQFQTFWAITQATGAEKYEILLLPKKSSKATKYYKKLMNSLFFIITPLEDDLAHIIFEAFQII